MHANFQASSFTSVGGGGGGDIRKDGWHAFLAKSLYKNFKLPLVRDNLLSFWVLAFHVENIQAKFHPSSSTGVGEVQGEIIICGVTPDPYTKFLNSSLPRFARLAGIKVNLPSSAITVRPDKISATRKVHWNSHPKCQNGCRDDKEVDDFLNTNSRNPSIMYHK